MATFNYTVDTHPMAQQMSSVSEQVQGTTTAVITMQHAIITAEEAAANHVCENVNKGFFALVLSQISQKIARLQSDVDSHLMRLRQQKIQLEAIKTRMEKDYNMIASRYLKLFNGLNANLKQRIFDLDKPVIDFTVKEVEKLSNRTKLMTATIPVAQLESLALSQQITASSVKFRGRRLLGSMSNFLSGMTEQKHVTSRILLSDYSNTATKAIYIPAVICETNYEQDDMKNVDITVNKLHLDHAVQSFMKNTVRSVCEQLQWQDEREINRELKSEFSRLISSSNVSSRVMKLANKMFLANHFQTLKK